MLPVKHQANVRKKKSTKKLFGKRIPKIFKKYPNHRMNGGYRKHNIPRPKKECSREHAIG